MIGGIVVGVLLVGFLAVNLLTGGGGNEAFPSFSFHPSSPSTSSSASGSPQLLPPPALSGRDRRQIDARAGRCILEQQDESGKVGRRWDLPVDPINRRL